MKRPGVRMLLALAAVLLVALSAASSGLWAAFGVFFGAMALHHMTQPWIDQHRDCGFVTEGLKAQR